MVTMKFNYKMEGYKRCILSSIKNTLKKLNHSFDYWLGESDVNHLIPGMISDLEKNKKISIDQGAYVSNEDTEPKILLKSDGSCFI